MSELTVRINAFPMVNPISTLTPRPSSITVNSSSTAIIEATVRNIYEKRLLSTSTTATEDASSAD
jgi:hypothetical protein